MEDMNDLFNLEMDSRPGKKGTDWEKEKNEYKKVLKKFYNQNMKLTQRCKALETTLSKYRDLEKPEHIIQAASKYCTPHQLSFIEAQLFNNPENENNQWSGQMRDICRGLYYQSPSGYHYMSQIFTLPPEDQIVEWTICSENELPVPNSPPRHEKDDVLEAEVILDEIAFEQMMSTVI